MTQQPTRPTRRLMCSASVESNALTTLQGKSDTALVARAALAGFELVKLADGSWLASRWGMFRDLSDEEQVERFLSAVGAPE